MPLRLPVPRILWLLIPLIATPAAAFDDKPQPPHIVFILTDDMGYGDPGCYNPQSGIRTPAMDSVADAGMRFTDAHAAGPLCHLSRFGLITGRYPFRGRPQEWRKKPTVDATWLTLPRLLKSAGYRTAMVGKWHLGFDESAGWDGPLTGGPIGVGFDSFFGIRASTDIPPYFYIRNERAVQPPTDSIEAGSSEDWSPIQGEFWRAGGIAPDMRLSNVLPRFTSEAVNVIDQYSIDNESAPLFLYLAYPAPHTPWLPSEKFAGRSAAGMYGDFTEMVDAEIGRVLTALERRGMQDNTLLFISSDNGPTWYDSDAEKFGHDASGGLRGMKADAWEGGHRVPFLVRWPNHVPAGAVSDRTICFTDVLATVGAITDHPVPAAEKTDSISFAEVMLGREPDDTELRKHLTIVSGAGLKTIRRGPWKLIDGLGSGGFTRPNRRKPGPGEPPGQLYNLDTDPGELHNLYAERPALVAELMQLLQSETGAGGR